MRLRAVWSRVPACLLYTSVYDALNLENCMALRSSYGGPAVAETARQIGEIEQFIQKIKENR